MLGIASIGFSQSKSFTKLQVEEDLSILKDNLKTFHPNLFLYSSSEDFESFFNEIDIPENASEQEAYQIISSASSLIKDGHTMFYPDTWLISKHNLSHHFIPLKVYWDGLSLYLVENYSEVKDLKAGSKINSINGLPSSKIINRMMTGMMRDGDNIQYPIWVINNYFFEYYSYFFGCKELYTFDLEFEGSERKATVVGMLKADLLERVNGKVENKKAIYTEYDMQNKLAILTIKDWHDALLKKYYEQNFKKEITKIFEQIDKQGIEHLILDLRNNQGGDLKNSKLVLSYLLNVPFRLVEEYKVLDYGTLVNTKGPELGIHKPKSKTFDGDLYVLINGGSFSNTSIFSSVLKKHNRATFIGTETGGSEYVLAAYTKNIVLPNSKIQVEIPTKQFLIKDYSIKELSGVKADHPIELNLSSIIDKKDEQKEFAKGLITN